MIMFEMVVRFQMSSMPDLLVKKTCGLVVVLSRIDHDSSMAIKISGIYIRTIDLQPRRMR